MQASEQTAYYDRIWALGHVWSPTVWPEWPILEPLIEHSRHRLEIGAGSRPRLPIAGTWFVDLSFIASQKLGIRGGLPVSSNAMRLPFANDSMDLVTACEVIEHLAQDEQAFAEIARVLRPGGHFVLSVPLQQALWTNHDVLAGHFRRYEPLALTQQLAAHGFEVTGFYPAFAGGYSHLKRIGAWLMNHAPRLAIVIEDRVTLPAGVALQRYIRPTTQLLPTIPPESTAPGGLIVCVRQP